MEKIKIIGIKDLDDREIEAIKRLSEEYYAKAKRSIKNLEFFSIHVKKKDAKGQRTRYEAKLKTIAPAQDLEASASEWDINAVLHKVFKEILRIAEHKFRD